MNAAPLHHRRRLFDDDGDNTSNDAGVCCAMIGAGVAGAAASCDNIFVSMTFVCCSTIHWSLEQCPILITTL